MHSDPGCVAWNGVHTHRVARGQTAPGQILCSTAVENGIFASILMFRIGCVQLGVSAEI